MAVDIMSNPPQIVATTGDVKKCPGSISAIVSPKYPHWYENHPNIDIPKTRPTILEPFLPKGTLDNIDVEMP